MYVKFEFKARQGFLFTLFLKIIEDNYEDELKDIPKDAKSNSLLDRVQLLDRVPDILTPGQ